MIVITCVLVAINIFLLFLLPELGSAILHLEDSIQLFLSGVEKKSKDFFDGNEEILRYIDKMELCDKMKMVFKLRSEVIDLAKAPYKTD